MMIDENTFLSAQECREKAATLSKKQNNGQKL